MSSRNRHDEESLLPFILLCIGGVIALIACIYVLFNIKRIEAHEAAIVVKYGREVESVGFGYTFEGPTERIIQFPISQQTLTERAEIDQAGNVTGGDAVKCQDRNGIPIFVDVPTNWRIDTNELEELFKLRTTRTGIDEIEDDIVDRDVEKAVTNACSRYSYYDLFGEKRGEFIKVANENLKEYIELAPRGHLILDDMIVGETHLEPAQRAALSAVDEARAAANRAEEDIRRAENEAKSAVAASEGQRQSAILDAQGKAEAQRINAEGEAESIRIIQDQLQASPDYLDYLTVTQWNGQMPYVTGEGGTLFQLPAPGE
jgi:regulator of protease activity HflC (stomatin/prohibitin superfamily)